MWYETTGLKARGGYCEVYNGIAHGDEDFRRPVVLKMLRPQHAHNKRLVKRLRNEAQLLSKVFHPNVAQVLDYVVLDNLPTVVMELVRGDTVRKLDAALPDDAPRRARLADLLLRQIARAMHEIQETIGQSFVHGDLSPSNIVMADSRDTFKLIDFGEAAIEKPGRNRQVVSGTSGFHAPELPHTGPTMVADIYALGHTVKLLRGPVHEGHEELLDRMTADKATDRFQSWKDVLAALGEPLGEVWTTPDQQKNPAGWRRRLGTAPAPGRFRRFTKAAGLIAGILMFAAAICYFIPTTDAPAASVPAIAVMNEDTAALHITGLPRQTTDISVDDQSFPYPPPPALSLQPGLHHIQVRLADGRAGDHTLTLGPGQALVWRFKQSILTEPSAP